MDTAAITTTTHHLWLISGTFLVQEQKTLKTISDQDHQNKALLPPMLEAVLSVATKPIQESPAIGAYRALQMCIVELRKLILFHFNEVYI